MFAQEQRQYPCNQEQDILRQGSVGFPHPFYGPAFITNTCKVLESSHIITFPIAYLYDTVFYSLIIIELMGYKALPHPQITSSLRVNNNEIQNQHSTILCTKSL